MASTPGKQNLTISISRETVRKAENSGCSALDLNQRPLADEIEKLVGVEDAWERSERSALALLEHGFHLGGMITVQPGRVA